MFMSPLLHSFVTSWVCAAWLACQDEWYWSYWTMSATSPSAHDWDPSWRNKRSGKTYTPSWVSSLGLHLITYLYLSLYDIWESHSGSDEETSPNYSSQSKCMWEDSTCFLAIDRWFSSLRECRLIAFEFLPDNPRSLKHLCRLEIRKHMTVKRLCNTTIMNSFPPLIKNYLLYKEYDRTWSKYNNESFLVRNVLSLNVTYRIMYCMWYITQFVLYRLSFSSMLIIFMQHGEFYTYKNDSVTAWDIHMSVWQCHCAITKFSSAALSFILCFSF